MTFDYNQVVIQFLGWLEADQPNILNQATAYPMLYMFCKHHQVTLPATIAKKLKPLAKKGN